MSAAARQMRLFQPAPLADLGELDVRPRLANSKCWAGYAPGTLDMPGRNHPGLAMMLMERLAVGADSCVFDPFCGSGLFLCEARKRGAAVCGLDISKKAVRLAAANLFLVCGDIEAGGRLVLNADAAASPYWPVWKATHIITSPVYRKQNKNSGNSELQTRLKMQRGLKAQLEFWDSDTPGHLARVTDGEFWRRLDTVWRRCLALARPSARLVVVTKDRVRHGEIVPFTAQVAESIGATGWRVEGLLWRQLAISNTHQMQIWHAKQRGRTYPLVTREYVIVARKD